MTGDVSVDASAAFGHALRVRTTHEELERLIQRMRTETREAVINLSNRTFRACTGTLPEEGTTEFERYCGDVLVFYCARNILDGRKVPTMD